MSKPIGYCKAIPRGMCIVINIYNRERKREKGEDGGRMERRKEKKREGGRRSQTNFTP